MRRTLVPFSIILALVTGVVLAETRQVLVNPAVAGTDPRPTAAAAVVGQFYAAANEFLAGGDDARIEDILAEDFVDHAPRPGTTPDRAGVVRALRSLRSTAPAVRLMVLDVVAERDRVAMRVSVAGADNATFLGLPITPDSLWATGEIFRVEAGRISERWAVATAPPLLDPLLAATVPIAGPIWKVVTLERWTLAPSAVEMRGTDFGFFVLLVDAGTLTVRPTPGAVGVLPVVGGEAGAWDRVQKSPTLDAPAVLGPGDGLVVTKGGLVTLRNEGAVPVVVLVVVAAVPGPVESPETSLQTPTGVRHEVLAGGPVSDLPTGEVSVSIGRAVLEAGTAFPAHKVGIAELVAVEAGSLALVNSGRAFVSAPPTPGRAPPARTRCRRAAECASITGPWPATPLRGTHRLRSCSSRSNPKLTGNTPVRHREGGLLDTLPPRRSSSFVHRKRRITMSTRSSSSPRFSRRLLVGSSLAGAALLPLGPAHPATAAASLPSRRQDTATPPAGWRTWILSAPDELRPPAPTAPTTAEIDEVLAFQEARTDEDVATVARWHSRPAVLVWTELAYAAFEEFLPSPIREYRANALLQTAMYDAVVAAYAAQDAYASPAPATLDTRITPIEGIAGDRPAFPSEHAAVAGAAEAFLTALLPDAKSGRFSALAEEAATARLQAGLNLRRDTDAGLALGRAIGARAFALAAADAPASAWDGGGRLTGPGYWEPTPPAFVENPAEPLAPTWHRWVLTSADQFRPAPPPAYDSPGWHSQLAAVREAVARRTFAQARAANFWQGGPATTSWYRFATDLIARGGLDLPQAARVLALMGVAIADAEIAAWDGKYAYWTARPITADPDLDVLFPTPPFPSYPSAHSTVSNAAAVVLAHLFPEDAADLLALAAQAADSRAWGGIHFPIDNDAGQTLGRSVGHMVTAIARTDGAEIEV